MIFWSGRETTLKKLSLFRLVRLSHLVILFSLLLMTACSSEVFNTKKWSNNPAYQQKIDTLFIPPLIGQFVILHPEQLGQELQITSGLDSIMLGFFTASLLSENTNSSVQFLPISEVVLLEDKVTNPEIQPGFFIKANLPQQKLAPNAKNSPVLLIHEWFLGFGIESNSFYDQYASRQERDPKSAKGLGCVMSYSLWDQAKAQVIQSGVVEAVIPRKKIWETDDFKSLANQITLSLYSQIETLGSASK